MYRNVPVHFLLLILAGGSACCQAAVGNLKMGPPVTQQVVKHWDLSEGTAGATIFREGDTVIIYCPVSLKGDPDYPDYHYTWSNSVYVDEQKIGTFLHEQSKGVVLKCEECEGAKWKAQGIGTHTVTCKVTGLAGFAETTEQDNTANRAIVVKPAGEPGVMEISPPVILSPVQGSKFGLRPDLNIEIRANVGSPNKYLQWHLEVIRRGSGNTGPFETLVLQDSQPVSSLPLQSGQAILNLTLGEWFVQHAGAGQYAARVYLSEQRPDGNYVGPSERVEFDVTAPSVLSMPGARDTRKPASVLAPVRATTAPATSTRSTAQPAPTSSRQAQPPAGVNRGASSPGTRSVQQIPNARAPATISAPAAPARQPSPPARSTGGVAAQPGTGAVQDTAPAGRGVVSPPVSP